MALSIVVLIFKLKGYIRNCSCYRAVKILEDGVKVVERVVEKRLHRMVTVYEMRFGCMSVMKWNQYRNSHILVTG